MPLKKNQLRGLLKKEKIKPTEEEEQPEEVQEETQEETKSAEELMEDKQELTDDQKAIIAIEQGKYVPSLELAFKIAVAFGVKLEEVFQYE